MTITALADRIIDRAAERLLALLLEERKVDAPAEAVLGATGAVAQDVADCRALEIEPFAKLQTDADAAAAGEATVKWLELRRQVRERMTTERLSYDQVGDLLQPQLCGTTVREALSRRNRPPSAPLQNRLRAWLDSPAPPLPPPTGEELKAWLRTRLRDGEVPLQVLARQAGVGPDMLEGAMQGIEIPGPAFERIVAWAAGQHGNGAEASP